MWDLRAYDFCFANPNIFEKKPSNIMDLLDREAWKKLLTLCKEKNAFDIEKASDYELFQLICALRSDLQEHALLRRSEFLIQDSLGLPHEMDSAHCEELWKRSAELFEKESLSLGDLLTKGEKSHINCVFPENDLPDKLPSGIRPVLWGNLLCNTEARTWESWKAEMASALQTFQNRNCQLIYFVLTEQYRDADPNPYSVELALRDLKNEDHKSLLLAQVFRFLSENARKNHLTVILRVQTAAKEIRDLLCRTVGTVGLADTVLLPCDYGTRLSLLQMATELSDPALKCGVCLDDCRSDFELELALSATLARYPKGQISLLSGSDLRYRAFEWHRLEYMQKYN